MSVIRNLIPESRPVHGCGNVTTENGTLMPWRWRILALFLILFRSLS